MTGLLPGLLLAALLAACVGAPPSTGSSSGAASAPTRVLEAPFFIQDEYQCGPAALASVLRYWGRDETPESIAAEIYNPRAAGSLETDLMVFARERGFQARIYDGGFEDLRRNIDAGRPLVILVDYGVLAFQQGHYLAVVGYGQEEIVAHTGHEGYKRIPLRDLEGPWSKTRHWTLLVSPKTS